MPYSDDDCDHIDPSLSRPDERQIHMHYETDPKTDPKTNTETELVTETLVEEVSIDGMCGVY
jgi:mycofactocin precursor peptide MftA